MQEVGERHHTELSWVAVAPGGAGKVPMDHEEPFHSSATALSSPVLESALPTAQHRMGMPVALVQETA
jgi:hypothetical protein